MRQINDTTLRALSGIPKEKQARIEVATREPNSMTKATLFLISLLILIGAGCVSVKLGAGGGENKRAEGVEYREPSSTFTRTENPHVDVSWQNGRTGNVLSYLSDCKDPSDPPLDSIVQGVIAGLSDLKIDSRETVDIQGREGRRVLASGKVDGVPSLIDLLVFKRNHCIYILTYVGVKNSFSQDRAEFGKFIEGFRAP